MQNARPSRALVATPSTYGSGWPPHRYPGSFGSQDGEAGIERLLAEGDAADNAERPERSRFGARRGEPALGGSRHSALPALNRQRAPLTTPCSNLGISVSW